MSVKLKDFKTDFTEFLHSNLPHTVKVVTDNKILECSSLLLSQHSSTLKDMISKDNEIFMLDYQCVEDLLVLLYGGSIELSLENCLEFIKFACQFGISGVVEQVFNFLSSVVDKSNLVSVVRVCIGALKASELFDGVPSASDYDFLWPCEEVLTKMNRKDVQTFIDNLEAEEVFAMFVNRACVKRILPVSKSLVTQPNVESVLQYLFAIESYGFVDSAAQCSINELTEFFKTFEKFSLTCKSGEDLALLKKSVLNQVSLNSLISDMIKSNADSSKLEESLKHWRIFTVEDMLQLCKYGSESFYIVEILLSWICFKLPSLCTVKRLFSSISCTKLPCRYLKYVEKITNKIGYNIYLESGKGKSMMNLPHSFARANRVEITHDDDCPTATVFYQCGVHDIGKLHHENKIEVSSCGTNITCSSAYSNPLSQYVVFGTSEGGERIPFYSDPKAACGLVCMGKPDLVFFKLA